MTDGPFAEGRRTYRRLPDHHPRPISTPRSNGAGSSPGLDPCRSKSGRFGTIRRTDAPMSSLPRSEIERVFREEYGRAVAVLVRVFGDIDVAEEAVQDAFAAAPNGGRRAGSPPSPAGWIITTARNRAIDRFRREASHERQRHEEAALPAGSAPSRRRRTSCPTIACA